MKKFVITILLALTAVLGYKYLYPVFISREASIVTPPREEGAGEVMSSVFIGVVLDNSPEARPQYGLSQASVVFETVAESGITRVLALFGKNTEIKQIGPVRSARPYFVDWMHGTGIALAHSGGSTEALAKIAALGSAFKDINEFSAEHFFWRARGKPSPHNLFTSTELLKQYFENKNWDTGKANFGWSAGEQNIQSATTTEILVDFSYPQFAARYVYDFGKGDYQRFLGGKSTDVRASNVVVLYTASSVIDKKLLTIDLVTSGSGRAMIFRDGRVMQARWQKAGSAAPLKLLDADGSAIKLKGGPTWIGVLDQQGTAVWK